MGSAGPRCRTGERGFTSILDFKNGKVLKPDISSQMFRAIAPYLPSSYVDSGNPSMHWRDMGVARYIMYAEVSAGERFGLHTDTGSEFECQLDIRRCSKFTMLTYLTDDYEGGETEFLLPDTRGGVQKVVIRPRRNRTLVFDSDLLHLGRPVAVGRSGSSRDSGDKEKKKLWIGTEIVATTTT